MSITAIALAAALAPASPASSDRTDPAALKAAIVYNIGRFATWPPGRRQAGDLVLCVEQSHPLAAALSTVDGRPAGEGRLQVRRTDWPFTASCHLALVSAGRASPGNLQTLADQGVLTIGETNDFTADGAVRLITVGRQIRFEINNTVARRARVALSAQLLRLAVKVR